MPLKLIKVDLKHGTWIVKTSACATSSWEWTISNLPLDVALPVKYENNNWFKR